MAPKGAIFFFFAAEKGHSGDRSFSLRPAIAPPIVAARGARKFLTNRAAARAHPMASGPHFRVHAERAEYNLLSGRCARIRI
jgi:hypothetical protein